MKTKILKELKDATDYISGQDLCERLQVSRTAVWKHIKALKEEGYEIDSVTNKGYRLIKSPDLINEESVKSILHTKWLGKEVHTYHTLDSTNLEIQRLAQNYAPHGTVAVCEEQTMGKGRRGRSWLGQPGQGVWMSFLLRPEIAVEHSSMITLVTALAVARAIKSITGIQGEIKWPNDIIIHGKKICGILTELSAQMDEINYVIVGLGINVHKREFPKELKEKATSLFIEGAKEVKRSQLIVEVLKEFESLFETFCKTEDLSAFVEEYNSLLVHKDKEVRVVIGAKEDEYIAKGINQIGELIVEDETGKETTIMSGEVSVRGILGYV